MDGTSELQQLIARSIRDERGLAADREVTVFEPDTVESYLEHRRALGLTESTTERETRIAREQDEAAWETAHSEAAADAKVAADWDQEIARRVEVQADPPIIVKRRFWRTRTQTRNEQTARRLVAELEAMKTAEQEMLAEGWGPLPRRLQNRDSAS